MADGRAPEFHHLFDAVARAETIWEWARVAARTVTGDPARSPLIEMTSGERIVVELDDALPCEIDGGERDAVKRAKIRVKKHAITVCVPTGQLQPEM